MRRNETVLVYAVTGLLIVILGIAVIFGEESGQPKIKPAGQERGEGTLFDDKELKGQLPRIAGVKDVEGAGQKEGAEGEEVGKKDVVKEPGSSEVGDDQTQPRPNALDPDLVTQKKPADTDPSGKSQADPVPQGPVVPLALSMQVQQKLGRSARSGEYREVFSRRGDRLSTLTQRWCGSLDKLPSVETLNEDLQAGQPIPAGAKVVVPWVDDEDLLAAFNERRKRAAEIERKRGQLYTIKKGDSLWKIAVSRVGARQAPAYIKAVAKLNSRLVNVDDVREGQKLRLPHQWPVPK